MSEAAPQKLDGQVVVWARVGVALLGLKSILGHIGTLPYAERRLAPDPQPTHVGADGGVLEAIVKRTFQPNTRRRARKHGFRHRMSDRAGRAVVRARRRKGRQRLSA